MPATTIRLTTSGACASCGAHGASQHLSTCQPDVIHHYPLGSADPLVRIRAADKHEPSLDDEGQWRRLWYAPRIRGSKHVW